MYRKTALHIIKSHCTKETVRHLLNQRDIKILAIQINIRKEKKEGHLMAAINEKEQVGVKTDEFLDNGENEGGSNLTEAFEKANMKEKKDYNTSFQ